MTAVIVTDTADIAFIIAIVTLIGLGINYGMQVWNNSQFTRRDQRAMTVLGKIAKSLHETDLGSSDNAKLISELARKLKTPEGKAILDQIFVENVKENDDKWVKDIENFYTPQKKAPLPDEKDRDPIISGLADIERDYL
jgi:hypothetical protein